MRSKVFSNQLFILKIVATHIIFTREFLIQNLFLEIIDFIIIVTYYVLICFPGFY